MKEKEIRPQAIFDEYLQLAAIDTINYFNNVERKVILCPACGFIGNKAFAKAGFEYEHCPKCQTLFVSPRPLAEAFSRYYQESPSSQYWATTFYKETAEARREKLWKPKALDIQQLIKKYSDQKNTIIVDIGGGYGLFAEEMQKLTSTAPIVIEPGPQLAEICRKKGFTVVEKFLEEIEKEDLPHTNKTFTSFELFEHLHDPEFFMRQLYSLMSSGDLFIFTTLSGTGVDIQALWEDSKSVMPPHHLNFFNPYSVRLLLDRIGFETLQITTPGKLDVDIIANNQDKIKDRFWKTFIKLSNEVDRKACQLWISEQGWSSHMRVVCRKS